MSLCREKKETIMMKQQLQTLLFILLSLAESSVQRETTIEQEAVSSWLLLVVI